MQGAFMLAVVTLLFLHLAEHAEAAEQRQHAYLYFALAAAAAMLSAVLFLASLDR